MSNHWINIQLSGREVAILSCVLSRCLGWDDPSELERFLNTAADHVRGGFTDDEMHAIQEKLAEHWMDHDSAENASRRTAVLAVLMRDLSPWEFNGSEPMCQDIFTAAGINEK